MFSKILIEKHSQVWRSWNAIASKHLYCICYKAYLRLNYSSLWAWLKPYENQGKCFHYIEYALDQAQKFHFLVDCSIKDDSNQPSLVVIRSFKLLHLHFLMHKNTALVSYITVSVLMPIMCQTPWVQFYLLLWREWSQKWRLNYALYLFSKCKSALKKNFNFHYLKSLLIWRPIAGLLLCGLCSLIHFGFK